MKKKMTAFAACCVCFLMVCAVLSSCGKQKNKYSSYSFDYFDTVTTITGYAVEKEEFDLVCEEIFALLAEYHKLFTIYERYDGLVNLRTVNTAHETVAVDEKIVDLLLYAKEMYTLTKGEMNIAMGSVLSIWHEYREFGMESVQSAELPPMDALTKAATHTDIDSLVIDKDAGTVTLTDSEMTLDVGAIAKGYAVEMVAQMLEEKGICGYVLNVGGNVRTIGTKADGEKWLVGIENPLDDGDPYIEYLSLAGESLVTSGSYQRYYFVDGKSYHHIIDRDTLMPAEGYRSVSVICRSSADGDALSTALFCMPFEEGLALAESLEGVEVMWVFPDGEKRYSSGFSAYIADIG